MRAIVFVECSMGEAYRVREFLKQLKGVSGAYYVGSVYDLVLKVDAPNKTRLSSIVAEIKRAPGITSVLTSIVYNEAMTV